MGTHTHRVAQAFAPENSPVCYHAGSKIAAAVPAMDVAMNANTSQSSLEM